MTSTQAPPIATDDIRIGISSCLLGESVRFDGNHKRDAFAVDTLGVFVTFVPVCPEVELGMGVPRETIRLLSIGGGVRLVAPGSGTDHTDAMRAFATERVTCLAGVGLSGYILKKDSPSCGMERVRLYDETGDAERTGRGMFAAELLDRLPDLPIEEEGRLHDPLLRENFVERVFAYARIRRALAPGYTVGDLVRLHTREKLTLLAHEPATYQSLGRLVAAAKSMDRAELAERYLHTSMTAMRVVATRGRHTNVLQHMAGYFKDLITAPARAELKDVIEDYRRGLLPLIVPITLVKHHVRMHDVEYLADQHYLTPHPKELLLRNHV